MKEAVRANFDASVDAYETYERATGRFATLTRRLLGAMADAAGRDLDLVLDAGAGTGASTAVLADDPSGPTPVALDLSREMLAENRAAARVQGDVDALPFAADSFDGVAFTASLFLVPDPAVAVAEAKRVLRPGGVVGAVAPAGWQTPDGTDAFRDLDRESRSPVAAATVREAIAAAFETETGTGIVNGAWGFETSADELRRFHAIPAMAARLYPGDPPARRIRKAQAALEPLEGRFVHRWEWTVGIEPVGLSSDPD